MQSKTAIEVRPTLEEVEGNPSSGNNNNNNNNNCLPENEKE